MANEYINSHQGTGKLNVTFNLDTAREYTTNVVIDVLLQSNGLALRLRHAPSVDYPVPVYSRQITSRLTLRDYFDCTGLY